MNPIAATPPAHDRAPTRLSRGTLTREVILEAALAILDEGQASKLTFARLGKELGASPTAMYRHFTSREDIVTAVADELIGLSIHDYKPSENWVDSLRDLAYRAWHAFAEHPAAATHTFYRVTLGPHETAAVEAILEELHKAGWSGPEAVERYRMFAHLVLALSGRHAARIAAAMEAGAAPGGHWRQDYQPANPSDYPRLNTLRLELQDQDEFSVYQKQVEALLVALKAELPNIP